MKQGLFHGRPLVEDGPGAKDYVVIQTPERWFGYRDSRGIWWIPRPGLHSDQASMRLWMQIVSQVYDDEFWGCYPHDDAYQFATRLEYPNDPRTGLPDLSQNPRSYTVTRDEADYYALDEAIFTQQILYPRSTMNNLQRAIVYHSVRIGAWKGWNRHDDGRQKSGPRWGFNPDLCPAPLAVVPGV